MVSLMLPPPFAMVVVAFVLSSSGRPELIVVSFASSLSDLFNEKVKLLWLPPQLEPPPPAVLPLRLRQQFRVIGTSKLYARLRAVFIDAITSLFRWCIRIGEIDFGWFRITPPEPPPQQ